MSDLFNSWKEIAQFFGKGVRTVQRWECDLGLPIHRPNVGKSNIVFAIRSELETWISAQRPLHADSLREAHARIRELEEENAELRKRLAASIQEKPRNTNQVTVAPAARCRSDHRIYDSAESIIVDPTEILLLRGSIMDLDFLLEKIPESECTQFFRDQREFRMRRLAELHALQPADRTNAC